MCAPCRVARDGCGSTHTTPPQDQSASRDRTKSGDDARADFSVELAELASLERSARLERLLELARATLDEPLAFRRSIATLASELGARRAHEEIRFLDREFSRCGAADELRLWWLHYGVYKAALREPKLHPDDSRARSFARSLARARPDSVWLAPYRDDGVDYLVRVSLDSRVPTWMRVRALKLTGRHGAAQHAEQLEVLRSDRTPTREGDDLPYAAEPVTISDLAADAIDDILDRVDAAQR